jgi:hydroxymethylglutaryl-CoA lyase
VLTPNLQGYEAARAAGAQEVAVFAAASESFSRRNVNASIAESLARFRPVLERARAEGVPVRGYVSVVAGCPFEGPVRPGAVAEVAARLHELGCYEISLGDTIGVGTPAVIADMLRAVCVVLPASALAIHCHDTYGMAVANVREALHHGVRVVDASIAGLGGCPYAPGATGNVATEDVAYLLRGLGVLEPGVDLEALVAVGNWVSGELGRPNASRAARALTARRKSAA